MKRRGLVFTLVELLVVIGIIAVLSALLLPALQKAKATGKKVYCLGNHRQLVLAMSSYTSDYDGWFLCNDRGMDKAYRQYYWPSIMNEYGYTKQGRSIGETSFTCPENVRPYSERTTITPSDYLLNSNQSSGMWGDLGGGLQEGVPGAVGCRQSQILNSSGLILFAEVDEYSDATIIQVGKATVSNPRCFVLGVQANMGNYKHQKACNYGFADGHAESISGRSINWRYFSIRSTSYDKYSPLCPL